MRPWLTCFLLSLWVHTADTWSFNFFTSQGPLAPESPATSAPAAPYSFALRSLAVETENSQWQPCAAEGQTISRSGKVRFGWGSSWVNNFVQAGSPCAVETFHSDPMPRVVKVCECEPQRPRPNGSVLSTVSTDTKDASKSFMDFGVTWTHCGVENELCSCASGKVRFGTGERWILADLDANITVTCSPKGLAVSDPFVNRRKECFCRSGPSPPTTAKVAIALMSRQPIDIATWLKYHVFYMGLDHVFLEIEDTPGFSDTLFSLPKAIQDKITLLQIDVPVHGWGPGGERPTDNYKTLQNRQMYLMSRAQSEAAKMGMDWLVHVDDDELLYSNSGRRLGDILANMPDHVYQLHLPNTEAVYPSSEVRNCFAETSEVNTRRSRYASYANGKSAIRLRYTEELRPLGPHMWAMVKDGGFPPSLETNEEPFGAPLTVLHYESCPFRRWEDKFWGLAVTTPDEIAEMPFPFYKESIKRMQHCRSQTVHEPVLLDVPGCQEEQLVSLWSRWKTRKNHHLRDEDFMPIHIPWKQILAA